MTTSVFEKLNKINVNDKVEKKNGLSYLAWAYAWGEAKKLYPLATYTIYERESEHGPINYFTDGMTCWVKTGVTIEGLEHIEELPVMDFKNKSISLENVTSFDVNKAIQRSLTKALARHGLGLYIYAGEDLPEEEQQAPKTADLIAENSKLKATMDSYGISYRVKLNDYILKKAKVQTQDIGALNGDEIKRLNSCYTAIIKKFKQQQGE